MIYVALLRGINVGGNNKINMLQLRAAFEQAGMKEVTTYINSGNVIFRDNIHHSVEKLTKLLEETIYVTFGFETKILIRTITEIETVVKALPDEWQNDLTMKCDVMFLWKDIDDKNVLDQLVIKPGIDTVHYVPGAVLFAVDRQHITKSGLVRIIGTPIYKKMTIRNCNTTRKIFKIMDSLQTTTPS